MKVLLLVVAVVVMACSPRPVTKPPAFNVVCLSQGDTLFVSDSVYVYKPPQINWGTDYGWRFAIRVSYWRGAYSRRERETLLEAVGTGEIVEVTGDCVVRRIR